MSLIYNALREHGQPLPARAPRRALQRPAGLALAVLIAIPAGYATTRIDWGKGLADTASTMTASGDQAAPTPDQAARRPQATDMPEQPTHLPPAPSVPAVAANTAPAAHPSGMPAERSPEASAAHVQISAPERTRTDVTAAQTTAVSAQDTDAAAKVAPPEPRSQMASRQIAAGSLQVRQRSEGSDDSIAALQARLQQAIADQDLVQAGNQLALLEQQLPADSLTLLRARAWLAHAGDDTALAVELYRRILGRVPDDAHAGANLALLLAASGQNEQARVQLARLSLQHADNPLVRRARALLETGTP